MKVTKLSGHCQIYVEGMTMRCPLCSTVVQSGEMHECKTLNPDRIKAAPKPKALK